MRQEDEHRFMFRSSSCQFDSVRDPDEQNPVSGIKVVCHHLSAASKHNILLLKFGLFIFSHSANESVANLGQCLLRPLRGAAVGLADVAQGKGHVLQGEVTGKKVRAEGRPEEDQKQRLLEVNVPTGLIPS